MGFFEKPLFDFNEDGKTDCMEWSIGMQMIASSSQEEIESTEDDAFYLASDDLEDEDDEDNNGYEDIDIVWMMSLNNKEQVTPNTSVSFELNDDWEMW